MLNGIWKYIRLGFRCNLSEMVNMIQIKVLMIDIPEEILMIEKVLIK